VPLKTSFITNNYRFPKEKLTQAIDKKMQSAVYQAARAWLRAVILKVPVWSGQALGSVKYAKGRYGPSAGLFLGQYLKIQIPLYPVFPRPNKNPQTGGVQGRYSFSHSNNQYRFSYQTSVIYFVIQEFYNVGVSPSAPWHALTDAEPEFRAELRRQVVGKLPKISDLVRVRSAPILPEA
jgi:hypothetical protein